MSDGQGDAVPQSQEYRVVVKKVSPDQSFDIPTGAVGVSIDWEAGAVLSGDKYLIRYAVPAETVEAGQDE